MTDSEKLDLLLEKVIGLETDVIDMKTDVIGMKTDIRRTGRKSTLILDEVERVHEILDKHKADKSKHIA